MHVGGGGGGGGGRGGRRLRGEGRREVLGVGYVCFEGIFCTRL